mgnify:FL=1
MEFLLKFGKKEHLEQLKNGIVHFSPIELFQEDVTTFRGDKMEGKEYLGLSKPFVVNGVDISAYIEEAVISGIPDCPVRSFSASLLSHKNCHMVSEDTYALNDNFIAEMSQFGDHALLFNFYDFVNALVKNLEAAGCGYGYHPIKYIDKRNHGLIREYYDKIGEDSKSMAHLFVKDTANSYPLQNEWRFVFFDDNNYFHLGEGDGKNLCTEFSTQMPVFTTDELCTLRCSGDCLFGN